MENWFMHDFITPAKQTNVNTLANGEVVTVVMSGRDGESWTGSVLAVDETAVRLALTASTIGPIRSAEKGTIILPWCRIGWVEPEAPPSELLAKERGRTDAVRRLIPHLSDQELARLGSEHLAEAFGAKRRGDCHTHREASARVRLCIDEEHRRKELAAAYVTNGRAARESTP
jgi:hypothetical protein